MKDHLVKVFDYNGSKGNLARVNYIDPANGSIDENSKFVISSKETYASVITFVKKSADNNYKIEFYSKTGKFSLCMHGLLASSKVVGDLFKNRSFTFNTENSTYTIQVDDELISILIESELQYNEYQLKNLKDLINPKGNINLLGSSFASIGSRKCFIRVDSDSDIIGLTPNSSNILEWSELNGCNGIFIYSVNKDNKTIFARSFNPRSGNNEDFATGIAAATLGLIQLRNNEIKIGEEIHVFQPDGSDKFNRIIVKVEDLNKVTIKGSAKSIN